MSILLGPRAALVDAGSGERLEGDELALAAARASEEHHSWPSGFVILALGPRLADVLTYVALREAGRPVLLVPSETSGGDDVVGLVERFRPAAVVGVGSDLASRGYARVGAHGPWVRRGAGAAVHPGLGLLLPTSGSTGDPKLVRLSKAGLQHNTDAIVSALGIRPTDVAITSLPLHYSFGLSVLNTHLRSSATVVLCSDSITTHGFWAAIDRLGVTTLAGVPQHFHALRRMRLNPADRPTLTDLVQAGGRLDATALTQLDASMRAKGGHVHVMYGQTEASPRMSVLPADRLADKAGSVGLALKDGRFSLLQDDARETTDPFQEGEVVFRGPNVMLGYAETAADLAREDTAGGYLRTGDRGYFDAEGFLFLTGRSSRLGKVFGQRVNLDHVEALARGILGEAAVLAATSSDDAVVVHLVADAPSEAAPDVSLVVRELAAAIGVHRSAFRVRLVDTLPQLPSGKTDYRRLAREEP